MGTNFASFLVNYETPKQKVTKKISVFMEVTSMQKGKGSCEFVHIY